MFPTLQSYWCPVKVKTLNLFTRYLKDIINRKQINLNFEHVVTSCVSKKSVFMLLDRADIALVRM